MADTSFVVASPNILLTGGSGFLGQRLVYEFLKNDTTVKPPNICFIDSTLQKAQSEFSRFAVNYTCTDFTFTSAKAEKELGFTPKFSQDVTFQKTIAYYHQHNTNAK